MPLMMDIDMDDLFDDTQSLLPPVSVAKESLDRLDELRLSASCQKVAWSKLGCIALINRDALGISLRNLYCDPENGKWALSKDYPVTLIHSIHDGQQLVHLLWSFTGSELAVFDISGRISLFTVYTSINKIVPTRPASIDPDDESGAIVGSYWLNSERQFTLYESATRNEENWSYQASPQRHVGPSHPMPPPNPPKSALVCITRSAIVRLLFQQPENKWGETQADLEGITTSSDILTHASFCSDKGEKGDKDHSLLLAVYTVAQQLRVYRIYIRWNAPANSEKLHPNQIMLAPIILIRNIKIEDQCIPRPLHVGDASSANANLMTPSHAYGPLSQLELVPSAPERRNHESTFPTILATFSHVLENKYGYLERSSIVARWELRFMSRALHSCFDQLSSKKTAENTNTDTPQSVGLARQDDVVLDGLVVSIQQVNANTILAFALSDGSIKFLDRASFNEIVPDELPNKVTSMPQSGFSFSNDVHCLDTALSPNFCVAISIGADGDPILRYPEHTLGSSDEFENVNGIMSAKVALALQWLYSTAHGNNNDDVLTIVKRFSSSKLESGFLREVYNALQVKMDFMADTQQDRLLRYPMIQRCLSMQYSLDYSGRATCRTINSKLTLTILHMRITSLICVYAFNNRDKTAPSGQWAKPETMPSLLGIFAWHLDLMNFVIDDLYSLKHLLRDGVMDRDNLKMQVIKLNTPAVSLLLASSSRGYMRYILRALSLLASGKANMSAVPVDAHNSFMDMIDSSPISISQFESILADVDASIRSAYDASGISESDRGTVEKNMIIDTDIPEVLMPAVKRLLTSTLDHLMTDIDRAALYFKNFSWLGLSDDSITQAYHRDNMVDAIRKVPLGKGARLRRCVRCCALMEDVAMNRQPSPWMYQMQKMCFCGCLWMLP